MKDELGGNVMKEFVLLRQKKMQLFNRQKRLKKKQKEQKKKCV